MPCYRSLYNSDCVCSSHNSSSSDSFLLHVCTCKQSGVEQACVCRSWYTHTHTRMRAPIQRFIQNSVWEMQINSWDLLRFSISANTKVPDCSRLTHIPPVSSAQNLLGGRAAWYAEARRRSAASKAPLAERQRRWNKQPWFTPALFGGSERGGDVIRRGLLSSERATQARMSQRLSGGGKKRKKKGGKQLGVWEHTNGLTIGNPTLAQKKKKKMAHHSITSSCSYRAHICFLGLSSADQTPWGGAGGTRLLLLFMNAHLLTTPPTPTPSTHLSLITPHNCKHFEDVRPG